MKISFFSLFLISFFLLFSCNQPTTEDVNTEDVQEAPAEKIKGPHIVFVAAAGPEYRSEESMPMLAQLAQRELRASVTICYPFNEAGKVDPEVTNNIVGLEALASADLMVLFINEQSLPDDQLKQILDYVDSGKPIVGFRTSLRAFKYDNDPDKAFLNEEWPDAVFGQKWITHHGYFEGQESPLTSVNLYANQKAHPVLKGVKPFQAYSSLLHVEGNGDQLSGNCTLLLNGQSLQSNYAESEEFPLSNPIAWVRTFTVETETPTRIFFTTLGHPLDFKVPSMRKLSMNGIAWVLGLEEDIPATGFNTELTEYQPDSSAVEVNEKMVN